MVLIDEGVEDGELGLSIGLFIPEDITCQVQAGDPQRAGVPVEANGEEDGEGDPEREMNYERPIPQNLGQNVSHEKKQRGDHNGHDHPASYLAIKSLEANTAVGAGAVHGEPVLEQLTLITNRATQAESGIDEGEKQLTHRGLPLAETIACSIAQAGEIEIDVTRGREPRRKALSDSFRRLMEV
jgi:hypothetical protein